MLSNNEQNERNSRITALAGTILFHALILGVLILFAFHTDFPIVAEEGVEVNFEDSGLETIKPIPEILKMASIKEPGLINEEGDASLVSKLEDENHNKKKKETTKPTSSKSKISIVETPDESTLIHRMPDGSKKAITAKSSSQNIAERSSRQLQHNSLTPLPNTEINREKGNIVSYELGGRGFRTLPNPTFNSLEDGKIVVSVKVNIEGKVISATAGANGTTISEPGMRKQAENAARISLFARDTNAPEEQRGTITYVIVKQK